MPNSCRCALAALVLLCWFIGTISAQAPPSPKQPTAAEDLEKQYERLRNTQQLDEAIRLVGEYVQKHPDDQRWRLELGMLLTHQGELDRAIQVWKEGLRKRPTDAPLHRAIAHFYCQQAEDGPTVTRANGRVTFRPSKLSDAEDKAWKAARLQSAAEHWRKAQSLEKDDYVAERLAQTLNDLEPTTHFKEIEELTADYPANLTITSIYSRGLLKQDRAEDAWARVQQLLERQPREPNNWRLAAEVQTALKRADEAALSQRKAMFYEAAPGFLEMDFSPETEAAIKLLGDREHLKANVQKWQADDSPLATRMLALVCYHHVAHGAVEDSCFEELEKRKAVDLALALVNNAQSTCTMRGGGRVLAKLKHPEAFEILSTMFQRGDHPFYPHEAELALAELGDPRAVPLLIAALQPDAPQAKPTQDNPFGSMGITTRRLRCAVALSSFSDQGAQQALIQGTKNPLLDTVCHAALFRATKNPDYLKQMKKTFGQESMEDFYAVSVLRLVDNSETKQIVADWEEKVRRERAKESEQK